MGNEANNHFANGTSTASSENNEATEAFPVLHLSASDPSNGVDSNGVSFSEYKSVVETFGVEYSTYLAYTYEAFTFTNIGGVVDVGYQYHTGAISGYSAGAQFGMALFFGGAGAKAVKYAERYTAYTKLRNTTASYRKNQNYSINTSKEEFVSNLEYNGYKTENGYKYTKNGSKGSYSVYPSRTSNGFPGAHYKESNKKSIKYSLGVPDYEFY